MSPATRTAPGFPDNPERWTAARITASHINTFLQMWARHPNELLTGEEFDSAKHLITHFQASCGVFVDAIHTAVTRQELIDINNEFYKMAVAKGG